jgi:hypothetical protein
MFAFVLGPVLFGWYGLFLGPLLLVLIAHFVRLALPELLAGDRPESDRVDPEPTDGESAATTDAVESQPSEADTVDTGENGDADTDQNTQSGADSDADS